MDAAVWTAIGILTAFSAGNLYYIGSRIEALGTRLDARIDSLEARLDARLDGIDARLDAVAARIDAHIERHAS